LISLGCALLIVGTFLIIQAILGPGLYAYLPSDHLASIPEIIKAYELSIISNPKPNSTSNIISTPTYISALSPTFAPSKPQWVWKKLPLYNWNVELPEGWGMVVLDQRPEPTGPGIAGTPMEHDCANYQLISPDRMEFINITMPCGFGEAIGNPCPNEAYFIQAVGNDEYLIRRPSYTYIGFMYELTTRGEIDDLNGKHYPFMCMDQTEPWVAQPIYLFWKVGHNNLDYLPDPDIDRIMLSLLTSNKYP
jgi:hypothetical protein